MTNAAHVANGTANGDIDEDLHSRQLAVYGRDTMRRMAASDVLIIGANGLGVEVGESLALTRRSAGLAVAPHSVLCCPLEVQSAQSS